MATGQNGEHGATVMPPVEEGMKLVQGLASLLRDQEATYALEVRRRIETATPRLAQVSSYPVRQHV